MQISWNIHFSSSASMCVEEVLMTPKVATVLSERETQWWARRLLKKMPLGGTSSEQKDSTTYAKRSNCASRTMGALWICQNWHLQWCEMTQQAHFSLLTATCHSAPAPSSALADHWLLTCISLMADLLRTVFVAKLASLWRIVRGKTDSQLQLKRHALLYRDINLTWL